MGDRLLRRVLRGGQCIRLPDPHARGLPDRGGLRGRALFATATVLVGLCLAGLLIVGIALCQAQV